MCPGQIAVFSCTSNDSLADPPYGHTTWVVSEAIAPNRGCALIHSQWPLSTTQCGSFQGYAVREFPADCYVSDLIVTVTQALNSTDVKCLFVPILGNRKVGSGTLQVIGIYIYIYIYIN